MMPKGDGLEETCIFITEGDSASGSITKSRDVNTQAVFSLARKTAQLLRADQKSGLRQTRSSTFCKRHSTSRTASTDLRYNKVIVATDADVDGMHIRLLMITFFLQFFPDLIKKGHVYILQTPLFRVRNKKKAAYCYTEEERLAAISSLTQSGNHPVQRAWEKSRPTSSTTSSARTCAWSKSPCARPTP